MPSKKLTQTLNSMREMGSSAYQKSVPLVTDSVEFAEFAKNLVLSTSEYTPVQNEFLELVNRIAFQIFTAKRYKNKLSALKKGYVAPLGTDIEATHINPVNPRQYNGRNLSGVLTYYDTDTVSVLFRLNSQVFFPISINRNSYAKAFVSWETLDAFIDGIIKAVFSGAEIREQNLFKGAINACVTEKICKSSYIPYPTEDNVKNLIKELRTTRSLMTAARSDMNNFEEWAKANGVTDPTPRVTWTEPNDIVVIMRSDLLQAFGVEVLASAFNMPEVEFRKNLIEIDDFSYDEYDLSTGKIKGHINSNLGYVVADKALFNFYDNLNTTSSDYIASSMTWQFFYHVWQTIGCCPFANAKGYVISDSPKLLGFTIDNTTVALSTATESETINYANVPDSAKSELVFDFVSGTYTGKSDTEVKDLASKIEFLTANDGTVNISIATNKASFTTGEGEFKFSMRDKNNLFPNVIISVGVTIS